MGDKPIIRHCKNCRYSCENEDQREYGDMPYCNVRYDYIMNARFKALLCRFYQQKESSSCEVRKTTSEVR